MKKATPVTYTPAVYSAPEAPANSYAPSEHAKTTPYYRMYTAAWAQKYGYATEAVAATQFAPAAPAEALSGKTPGVRLYALFTMLAAIVTVVSFIFLTSGAGAPGLALLIDVYESFGDGFAFSIDLAAPIALAVIALIALASFVRAVAILFKGKAKGSWRVLAIVNLALIAAVAVIAVAVAELAVADILTDAKGTVAMLIAAILMLTATFLVSKNPAKSK